MHAHAENMHVHVENMCLHVVDMHVHVLCVPLHSQLSLQGNPLCYHHRHRLNTAGHLSNIMSKSEVGGGGGGRGGGSVCCSGGLVSVHVYVQLLVYAGHLYCLLAIESEVVCYLFV